MREPEPMGYYAIRDSDNLPRVVHAVRARAPRDGLEISKEQADTISAAYRTDGIKRKKATDQNIVIAVLDECKDQIVAVVNDASAERDAAVSELLNRVKTLEAIINAIGEKAGEILEKPA